MEPDMEGVRVARFCSVLVVLLLFSSLVNGQGLVSVFTNQDSYRPDDTMDVTIVYTNTTSDTITLWFSSSCIYTFAIDSGFWILLPCLDSAVIEIVPPRQSLSWHDRGPAPMEAGTHTLTGWLGSIDTSSRLNYGIARTTFIVDPVKCRMLNEGWNLISTPSANAEVPLFASHPITVSRPYSYAGAYFADDRLRPGWGYWIKIGGSGSFISFPEQPRLADTITVSPGWSMIGALGVGILKSSVRTVPEGILGKFIPMVIHPTGYPLGGFEPIPDPYLRPGYGYWVKAKQSGIIILDSTK